jgi:hypothetical protein
MGDLAYAQARPRSKKSNLDSMAIRSQNYEKDSNSGESEYDLRNKMGVSVQVVADGQNHDQRTPSSDPNRPACVWPVYILAHPIPIKEHTNYIRSALTINYLAVYVISAESPPYFSTIHICLVIGLVGQQAGRESWPAVLLGSLTPRHHRGGDSGSITSSSKSDQMIIKKNVQYTVQYEEAAPLRRNERSLSRRQSVQMRDDKSDIESGMGHVVSPDEGKRRPSFAV